MRFLRFIPIGIVAVMAMSRAVNYRSVQSPEPFTPPKLHKFPINPDKLNLMKPPFMLDSFNLDSLGRSFRFNTIEERPQAHIMQPPVYYNQGPRINLDSLVIPGSISVKDRNHLISFDASKSEVSFGLPEKPQVGFGNSDDYTFPNRDFDSFPNRFPITPGGSSYDDIAIPESSDESEDNDSPPPVSESETVPDDKEATTSETTTEETTTPAEETTTPAEEVIDTNNQP